MKELYLEDQGKAAGPYPIDQVREFLHDGIITPDHLASASPEGPWQAIQVFGLLFPQEATSSELSPLLPSEQVSAQEPPPLPLRQATSNQPTGSSALVDCPDCGRQMSRKAPACPQCGRPRFVRLLQNLEITFVPA